MVEQKTCNACKNEFPANFEHFHSRTVNSKKYLATICKLCMCDKRRRMRKDNLEKTKMIQKKSIRRHQDSRNAYMRKWRARNPDKASMYDARSKGRRKAILLSIDANITIKDLRELEIKQGGICAYCKRGYGKRKHLDHVIPLSRGGTHTINNVVYACEKCNLNKYTKTPEEWVDRWYY